jgi:FlaA1/EpsC-like NDP-sugar epimerase
MSEKIINSMVIGAGEAGTDLINDIFSTSENICHISCIIDDNKNKWGTFIRGIPIVGGRDNIIENIEKYNISDIIFAIPSAQSEDNKEILAICQQTTCSLRILPSLSQFAKYYANLKILRNVKIDDLLGRNPSKIDLLKVEQHVKGKIILVSGGGGSIGSELCRQLATYSIKKLVILDINENNAYNIQQELLMIYPNLPLEVLIGSIRDKKRIEYLISTLKPDIIFHTAAHKHVPLMEKSPHEAIKNNVFGTLNLVNAADKYGVSNFLLISTDKAVNPINIMGASKRISEMIIQMFNKFSKTKFMAVRFGNVIGSNGSVIPLFQKQIAYGGPVRVTHPDITRYFMTTGEAVSLVLLAEVFANGGEIFILDMGEPVKIIDMAHKLIKLSGYIPDSEIKIVFSGLRPGEKLHEEILTNEKWLHKTDNNKILITSPNEINIDLFKNQLDELLASANNENSDIHAIINKIIPTFNANSVNTHN